MHPDVVDEDFPGYVPDLNLYAGVWGWTKDGRLANLDANEKDKLWDHVIEEVDHGEALSGSVDGIHPANWPAGSLHGDASKGRFREPDTVIAIFQAKSAVTSNGG